MIQKLDKDLIKRTNRAIGNIRLIASRSKRASVLNSAQKAEIVVNALDLFRKYVAVNEDSQEISDKGCTFKHDNDTLNVFIFAGLQADDIWQSLTKKWQKTYEDEYHVVWHLLEDVQNYLSTLEIERRSNAKK
jgi:hypothetical protein